MEEPREDKIEMTILCGKRKTTMCLEYFIMQSGKENFKLCYSL